MNGLFLLFVFSSFLGWIWETVFCTARTGHFQNRGFLFGPVCPIYGAGVLLAELLVKGAPGLVSAAAPWWQTFLVCAAGSAVLEFGTSYYLEKRFHARWWDYSAVPLNVQGRICLPVSLAFGTAGLAVVRWGLPLAGRAQAALPQPLAETLALALAALLGADLALTEASLSTLVQRLEEMEDEFTKRGELAYAAVSEMPGRLKAEVQDVRQGMEERGQELQAALSARIRDTAARLPWRQRHLLANIRAFHPRSARAASLRVGQRLKEAMQARREAPEKPVKHEKEKE